MKEFILDSRYLNPLTDFGFHKIFGNKDLLIHFLNETIKEEGLIKDIQYLIPEQWGFDEKDRKAIFDIYCITDKDEYFIVEMQKAKQPFFRDRSLYYASLPIQKQAIRGTWDFSLKAVYLVAILDFVLFNEFEEDQEQVIEQVHLVRDRTKTLYSDKLNFVFVELLKFRKTEKELVTNADNWLYSLKNLHLLKERPATIQGEIFEKLYDEAEIKKLTDKDMETYSKSILEYHDVRSAVDYAKKEGRKEGIEKGIEKGKIFVIQRCFQKNMPIEDIIDLTGFSKEQIIHYSVNGTL